MPGAAPWVEPTVQGNASALMACLGSEGRLAVVAALGNGPLSPKEVAQETGYSSSSTSQYIGRLKEVGLVVEADTVPNRCPGTKTYYELDKAVLRTAANYLLSI